MLGLCVKKSAIREGGEPWVPAALIPTVPPRYYNAAIGVGKIAPFVLTASPLSRLNSPAIPAAPDDFAVVFRR